MRISDWSSDVCSSDLHGGALAADRARYPAPAVAGRLRIARAEVPGLPRTQSARRGADAGDRRSAARRSGGAAGAPGRHASAGAAVAAGRRAAAPGLPAVDLPPGQRGAAAVPDVVVPARTGRRRPRGGGRSEEHTSELQSLMRISYAVFCLKKKTQKDKKLIQYINNAHNSINNET